MLRNKNAGDAHKLVEAVCPIHGVAIRDVSIEIDFEDGATAAEMDEVRRMAGYIIDKNKEGMLKLITEKYPVRDITISRTPKLDIQFKDEATVEQRIAAQVIIKSFDPSEKVEAKPTAEEKFEALAAKFETLNASVKELRGSKDDHAAVKTRNIGKS